VAFELLRRRFSARPVDIGNGHGRSGAGEGSCDLPTDAAGCACDDCDFSRQIH
jgi:hypothetical protein